MSMRLLQNCQDSICRNMDNTAPPLNKGTLQKPSPVQRCGTSHFLGSQKHYDKPARRQLDWTKGTWMSRGKLRHRCLSPGELRLRSTKITSVMTRYTIISCIKPVGFGQNFSIFDSTVGQMITQKCAVIFRQVL